MKKNILAIIPARGGSKGLPRKNILPLAGKPVIAWSINAARKSRHINRTIVSTDDREIAGVSKKYGAEVVIRPKELATDKAKTIDVILHLLNSLKEKENYIPDVVVLLQPTSPLRTAKDLDESIKIFLKKKPEFVVSFYESNSILWSFKIEKGYTKSLLGDAYLKRRRQDLGNAYLPNGAIYISTPKNILKYKGFYGKKVFPYIMPENRSVDIDYELDLKIAELIMKMKI